jgi:hypothetical protein
MRRPPVGADYAPTVGEMNRMREATAATWPGDPARAAKVITDLADLDDPPLRLLLGSDALAAAERSSAARAAEAQAWAEVTRSTDFAPAAT